jgi:predicted ferric reductase
MDWKVVFLGQIAKSFMTNQFKSAIEQPFANSCSQKNGEVKLRIKISGDQ